MATGMSPSELPDRYLRQSQVAGLREDLERVRAQMQELGQEIGESGSATWFGGEAEVNVLRDEMAKLQRQEAQLVVMLTLPVVEDSTIEAIRRMTKRDGVIRLGTTVVVEVDGDEERYRIVGAVEAKPTAGLISNESPVGKELLGKRAGDEISVRAPRGGRRTLYRVLRVEA